MKSQKQGNTKWTITTKGKVLTGVSAFFDIHIWLIITNIICNQHAQLDGILLSVTVARFKTEIEHENLHRNKGKTPLWKLPADQQHRRVVVFCLI